MKKVELRSRRMERGLIAGMLRERDQEIYRAYERDGFREGRKEGW